MATDKEVAEWYWDQRFQAELANDGIPPRELKAMRKKYVAEVLTYPKAMAELRQFHTDMDRDALTRMTEILRDDLAEKFFDEKVAPTLQGDKWPEDKIAKYRAQWVAMVLGARKELAGYRTRTGKVLTDAEIDELVAEAEKGYDVANLKPVEEYRQTEMGSTVPRRWDCTLHFVLTRGEFDLTDEHELYQDKVRRTPEPGHWRFPCVVEAAHSLIAQAEAHTLLVDLLQPRKVGIFVYSSSVVALP